MKLVLYSGGTDKENLSLDLALLKLVNPAMYKNPPTSLLALSKRKVTKQKIKITFIPPSSLSADVEFKEFVNHYQKFGITQFLNFPIDIPFDSILFKEAFQSDIIYLGGGNTFYFLKTLKQKKLLTPLKNFVKRGGILAGLSAGALITTPTITSASFPDFDCDENIVNLKNWKALNLVNFEFFPHFKNSPRYDRALLKRSRVLSFPLYACPDGSGLIVQDNSLTLLGKVFCFSQGKKTALT